MRRMMVGFVDVTFTLKWVDWGQANYTTECDTSFPLIIVTRVN